MSGLQIGSLVFAFGVPLALWAAHKRRPHPALERVASHGIAWLLLACYAGSLGVKYVEGNFNAANALPMQLCDWALFAVATALFKRSQTSFELAYFWGLCGTFQALLTPAIAHDLAWWKQGVFFLDHAAIVAGVLFLLLVAKMRPRSFWRVLLWSEIFLATALVVNSITGANYGFLSHKPENPSMLDLFSSTHWLYIAEINLTALVFFTVIYLPWIIADRIRERRASMD